MSDPPPRQRPPFDLALGARRAMLDNGFLPEFPDEVLREVERLPAEAPSSAPGVRDLRGMCWSSIDNHESKDLDQLEVAEAHGADAVRLMIAIADVDALVPKGSALDRHARKNSASVYTGVRVFPMLPERLSTDLTSLNEGEDRLAVVIELLVRHDGEIESSTVYRAAVRSRAKLAYDDIAAWLDGRAPAPPAVVEDGELERQVRLQDQAAQRLQAIRYRRGALDLETIEARPVTVDGKIVDIRLTHKDRAREMIEDFMIAANGAMARFLEAAGTASIRRVVRSPERWQRLVALAEAQGERLPEAPDSPALAAFLRKRRAEAPEHFAELSLSVVKLMGPGEYAVDRPGESSPGHFGLAVQDYTHSTAPNRRYADLVTQRLVKAVLSGAPAPYTEQELGEIARACTLRENDARKVERTTRKEAAAMLLSDRLGETFDAVVTGVSAKGTFVRLIQPPAEGRVVRGEEGLDVGDELRVRLVATEPSRGFIDFVRA